MLLAWVFLGCGQVGLIRNYLVKLCQWLRKQPQNLIVSTLRGLPLPLHKQRMHFICTALEVPIIDVMQTAQGINLSCTLKRNKNIWGQEHKIYSCTRRCAYIHQEGKENPLMRNKDYDAPQTTTALSIVPPSYYHVSYPKILKRMQNTIKVQNN